MAKKVKRKLGKKRSGGSKKTDLIIKLASVGIGYLGADTINPMIDKIMPKAEGTAVINDNLVIGLELGIGGLLLLKKLPVGSKAVQTGLTALGGVLVGAGLKRGLKKLGILSGYQNTPVIGRHRMAGYQSTPVIGAMGVPGQLTGVPNQLSGGYTPAGSGMAGYKSQGSGVMGAMSQNGSGMLRD